MNSDKWYIAKEKKRVGPYTYSQIIRMAAFGDVVPSDMVFKEGALKWMPARNIPWPLLQFGNARLCGPAQCALARSATCFWR